LSSSHVENANQYQIVFYANSYPAFDAEIILHGHEVIKTLDDLEPETDYTFKLRAVFDNAVTDWASATYTTGKTRIKMPSRFNPQPPIKYSLNSIYKKLLFCFLWYTMVLPW